MKLSILYLRELARKLNKNISQIYTDLDIKNSTVYGQQNKEEKIVKKIFDLFFLKNFCPNKAKSFSSVTQYEVENFYHLSQFK
ncbi:hypothetical protein BpHYR1_007942 [Brachionus plicatilis]|uniref:Uncharacterized protein n=1 Tax=Brachionus plicatilis TaxID=10195 RepID=A0A3M7PKR4_BRAPC|nr:hypothetical protein BpHYR1_007942 [Brachionus plicatilis]